MRRRYRLILAFCLSVFLTATWTAAIAQDEDSTLRVAVHLVEPFVMQEEDELVGFSVDLWDAIAKQLDIAYEWAPVDSVNAQLDAVQNGDADVALGAISINHGREEFVDFSFPYFRSGLLIMTRYQHESPLRNLFDITKVVFSPAILQLIALLFGTMFVVANVVWFVERHRNEDFDRNYFRGIWDGFWWAAVTVSTVGYGDKTVKGTPGRIISLFWIFAGLFIITQFTAGITATLAVQHWNSRINDLSDLSNRRVVTVKDTTSEQYLQKIDIRPVTVNEIGEAYPLLEAGKVDAVVYDAPVLQYHASMADPKDVTITNEPFNTEMYAIALPMGSEYRIPINLAILAMIETGEYDDIYADWFNDAPP